MQAAGRAHQPAARRIPAADARGGAGGLAGVRTAGQPAAGAAGVRAAVGLATSRCSWMVRGSKWKGKLFENAERGYHGEKLSWPGRSCRWEGRHPARRALRATASRMPGGGWPRCAADRIRSRYRTSSGSSALLADSSRARRPKSHTRQAVVAPQSKQRCKRPYSRSTQEASSQLAPARANCPAPASLAAAAAPRPAARGWPGAPCAPRAASGSRRSAAPPPSTPGSSSGAAPLEPLCRPSKVLVMSAASCSSPCGTGQLTIWTLQVQGTCMRRHAPETPHPSPAAVPAGAVLPLYWRPRRT